jgi:hypothetical protein
MSNTTDFKNRIICPECSALFEINDSYFESYFQSKQIICPICSKELDLWESLKKMLDVVWVGFGWHYILLGCQGKQITILLKPNEIYKLDLSKEIGGGELLYINYTPTGDGGLFPIQMHSNTPISHIKPKIIQLFPRSFKDDDSETVVQVLYWFATKEMLDDLSSMLILDAFQRFYEKNYRHMLISAQTSVEILQYKFFEKLLKENKITNKDKIENFLQDKVTFATQLFTLLPFLANIMNFPMWKPDSPVREGLKILNDNRNDVAHQGKLKKQLNDGDLQKALLSAFFALKYFKIIHRIND